MDYNHAALFVRVVRAGSFTAAGAAVGLPKSSLSRAVSQLERDLGVRLLQRTTRQLALTDAGRAYFAAVDAAVGGLDDAAARARDESGEPRGRVRITAPPDLADSDMPAAIAAFARAHPAIRLELLLTPRFVDLVGEGVDLAIRAGRLDDSSLVTRRIGDSETAIFASVGYLKERGRPRRVDDLADHDWVLYRASDGRATMRLHGPNGRRKSVVVRGAIVADDLGFCVGAVEAGAGLALLPLPAMATALRAGRVEPVLPGWRETGHTLNVVMPSRQVPARVALVRDFVIDYLTRRLAHAHQGCPQSRDRLLSKRQQ